MASLLQFFLPLIFSAHAAFNSGYVQFISKEKLQPFLNSLPQVMDSEIDLILRSPSTMWYDNESMIPVYQDSVTPILGVRANSIGRTLAVQGERIFGTDGHFYFPFIPPGLMGGVSNLYVLKFWAPPRKNNITLPTALWTDETTRWRWIFPKDTFFGELMFLKSPHGEWIPFEIRTRKRELKGWNSNVYRPFDTAEKLAETIKTKRPNWMNNPALYNLIRFLSNTQTLEPMRLEAPEYLTKTWTPIDGAMDYIPSFGDPNLVTELLKTIPFVSCEGKVWKENGQLKSYAASTRSDFSIVPRNFQAGLFPVTQESCNRCHDQVGRQIGEFNFDTLLYGEVWGEDYIFSWHPFDSSGNFYGAYHKNRILNSQIKAAGLVEPYQPDTLHSENTYKELPRPFKIIWH